MRFIAESLFPQRAMTDTDERACVENPETHGVDGGEEGIRTLDTLLTYTPLAGERLRPLGHLSGASLIESFDW